MRCAAHSSKGKIHAASLFAFPLLLCRSVGRTVGKLAPIYLSNLWRGSERLRFPSLTKLKMETLNLGNWHLNLWHFFDTVQNVFEMCPYPHRSVAPISQKKVLQHISGIFRHQTGLKSIGQKMFGPFCHVTCAVCETEYADLMGIYVSAKLCKNIVCWATLPEVTLICQ